MLYYYCRVVVLDKVTDFVLFISKLLCVSAVGIAAFFFFSGDISYLTDYVPKLNYYFAPVIVSLNFLQSDLSCFRDFDHKLAPTVSHKKI